VRIVRVPCSGRVDPLFVLRAFQEGADGVIVSGCHPGDCHYQSGNLSARRKLVMLRELLEFVGVGAERLTLSWVSASEGGKFADIVHTAVEKAKAAGPQRRLRRG
jgi:coenzyme F420-reducing hydrogenase delta subunit